MELTPRAIRVVLVEDHPMMRSAMEATLERASLEVVASIASASEAYEQIGALQPDVAVVDLGLPGESGLELARRLLRRSGDLAVVIYTGSEDSVALKDALDCGARALASKAGGPSSLVAAITAAATGGVFIAPELAEVIASTQRNDRPRVLSDREREILSLVAEGLSNEEIAARLVLSPETVRTHVRNLLRKLDAHSRVQAVVTGLRREEISL